MNVDAAFTIGKSHQVCEDFAITKQIDDKLFGVLCDGCSSSPLTDVGARLLALTSMDLMLQGNKKGYRNYFLPSRTETCSSFYTDVKFKLKDLLFHNKFLQNNNLDATVFSMQYVPAEKKVHIYTVGDGFVVAKHKTLGTAIYSITYPTGYPRYLSYELDANRKKEYEKQDQGAELAECWYPSFSFFEELKINKLIIEKEKRLTFDFQFDKNFEWISIFSDGVDSFREKQENGTFKKVHYTEVIKELTAFKSYKGEFVKRRFNRFVKDCEKRGWLHDDDVSMSTIYLGE